ncbi:DUF6644 family protein [Sphingobium sp.]|uniref:DUF6644 family protein n=1 Tax=Sphingobium sp. TaxID=1912891 RepID=UPI0028BDBE06|nr:DUF6644 family protein [Sphingobium sp.]
MANMAAWADRLAATPVSLAIQSHEWVIPTIQSIHILAIAAVMSSIAMLNLRLAGLIGHHQSVRDMAHRFLPWLWRALPVLLITGCLMIVGEPARELLNPFFWYKMTMLLAVVLLTLPLQRMIEDRPFREHDAGKRQLIRLIALFSLMLWLAIVFCGRWIAYA